MAFWSFQRLSPGPLPRRYLDAVPELVFEVRSPSDRWSKVVHKAEEYMEAGTLCVCAVDPKHQTVSIFRPELEDPIVLTIDEHLTLPDLLPGFSVPILQFFE